MPSNSDNILAAESPAFAEAVCAVVDGDVVTLAALLRAAPGLVAEHARAPHHATLLHYVAANGVEDELQRTPPNAVEIAELLLASGAAADAPSHAYDGRYATTMELLVSSVHPARAGVQAALVRTLCAHGADPDGARGDGERGDGERGDGERGDGGPMATALLFGYPAAIEALVACGARLDTIIFAAAAGRADLVTAALAEAGPDGASLRGPAFAEFPPATAPRIVAEQALVAAAMCDQPEIIAQLVRAGVDVDAAPPFSHMAHTALHAAALQGNIAAVRGLLALGADRSLRDPRHNATPREWALHAGRAEAAALLADD